MEKHKILVVDDEADICSCLKSYFEKRDFTVSTSGKGLEALSMMRSSKYDVVLLDLSLPDLNGDRVLEELRKNDKETKVIIVTGNEDATEKAMLSKLGVQGYCIKPMPPKQLLGAVHKALGLPLVE